MGQDTFAESPFAAEREPVAVETSGVAREVSRQSCNMHSRGSYENLKLLPRDAIVVPEKLRVSSALNTFLEAIQFASQSALTAAALSVIK